MGRSPTLVRGNAVADGRGFTLVEVLIVALIVGVLLSMSIVGYRHARIRGGEASAIAALEAINQAQFAFMQTCGNQRYAPTLASLGVPVSATGAPYLSPDLTQTDPLIKSGYLIQMGGTAVEDLEIRTCTGVRPLTAYFVTADPVTPGVTGSRFFGTNADRAIYENRESFVDRMPERGVPDQGSELRKR